jgi:hypothetical protein
VYGEYTELISLAQAIQIFRQNAYEGMSTLRLDYMKHKFTGIVDNPYAQKKKSQNLSSLPTTNNKLKPKQNNLARRNVYTNFQILTENLLMKDQEKKLIKNRK